MTFHSLHFLLIFLPLCYAGFVLVYRGLGWNGVYAYLVIVSVTFYAQFSPVLAAILVASVCCNFLVGKVIVQAKNRTMAQTLVILGVTANLLALGYFKYTNFFLDIANSAGGYDFDHLDIIVPIGISFYTFTQIGFLIEASAGHVRNNISFSRYALFASFFPCVTAGPLLLQREIFDQMEERRDNPVNSTRVAIGLTIFGIGLAKKVLLADAFAPYSDSVFAGVGDGTAVTATQAWIGAGAYTLQLYFDFSGYSDMAIGLAFLFGFRLPLNFNSPFKAVSISEFWNRWHMTMTRFFTTFLFTRMAMKNARWAMKRGHGKFGRWLSAGAVPVFYTFLLAGIWHGAGWTFVVFGMIHGTALAINHGWREWQLPSPPPLFGWALTMLVVITGLVVFRSPDLETALAILASMWGAAPAPATGAEAVTLDVDVATMLIVFGIGLVTLMPNSQELMRKHWVSCDQPPDRMSPMSRWVFWSPSAAWAVAIAALMVISATSIGIGTKFLYYDF